MFGTGLQGVVIAWLVLSHGGTTWHLAAMAALSAGVGVPASFLGGPLVDRFPRWAVTLVVEVGRAVPAALVALLAARAELRVEHRLMAATASSALHAVSVAAYGALLPQVLDRGSMVRVNGLWQAVAQIGVFGGAATGGMAISVLGGASALDRGRGPSARRSSRPGSRPLRANGSAGRRGCLDALDVLLAGHGGGLGYPP
jgi:hypothetical protein